MRLVLDESRESWAREPSGRDKGKLVEGIIDAYLSPRHRDSLGTGCAVAALGSDLARQPKKVRDVFTEKIEETLESLAQLMPAKTASRRNDKAIRLFSTMLGALILSRAVDEKALSRRILETVADELKGIASK